MLRQIKKKIIFTNVLTVTLILIIVAGYMIINTYSDLKNNVEMSLHQSIDLLNDENKPPQIGKKENGGHIQNSVIDPFNKTSEKELRYLTRSVMTVSYNKESEKTEMLASSASMDENTLSEAVRKVVEAEDSFGTLPSLSLYYYKVDTADGILISFADLAQTQSYIALTALRYLIICLVGLAIVLAFSIFISAFAIRPIKKTWEQEKRFVADVSHELKTPITVILANNSIIKAHPSDTVAGQMNWIESTDEEAEHMKKLIRSMLNLAVLESGNIKATFVPIDFSNLLEKCILQFEPVAFENGVVINSEITPGLIINGDETQLNQLAIILVDNAVKYARQNSEIKIDLSKKHNSVCLSVNSKSYIDKEDLQHIFERFYRADKSRVNSGENSYGLGLSIAKNITKNHKGNISVTSNQQNGTTFYVVFKSTQHK